MIVLQPWLQFSRGLNCNLFLKEKAMNTVLRNRKEIYGYSLFGKSQ